MADFDVAYKITMWNEWGSSGNDPHENDPGDEPTGYGLVEADFIAARKMGLVGDDVTPFNVTEEQARVMGRVLYWDVLQLDAVADQRVANKWFDMAYPLGTDAATERMQEALNDVEQDFVEVDGKVGPKTLAAVGAAISCRLIAQFKQRCADHYEAIADTYPEKRKYLKGWLERTNT